MKLKTLLLLVMVGSFALAACSSPVGPRFPEDADPEDPPPPDDPTTAMVEVIEVEAPPILFA
jgi:hypothetical protein